MGIAGLATLRRGFGLHQIPIDMNRRRIAFVYAPGPGHGFHAPDVARLETMPFAMNTIMSLAAEDWEVDVFLWEQPHVDYYEIFPKKIKFRYEVMPNRIF
jgi:hypothetical protein